MPLDTRVQFLVRLDSFIIKNSEQEGEIYNDEIK